MSRIRSPRSKPIGEKRALYGELKRCEVLKAVTVMLEVKQLKIPDQAEIGENTIVQPRR